MVACSVVDRAVEDCPMMDRPVEDRPMVECPVTDRMAVGCVAACCVAACCVVTDCGIEGRLAAAVRDNHAAPERLRGFPILVTHGTDDQQIPVRSAHDIRQALKPLGVAVDYHEFESGHFISDFNVGVLDDWLKRRLAGK